MRALDKNSGHITIGIFKNFVKLLDFSTIFSDFKDYDFGEFKVSNIYLMGSTLKSDGPVYSILKCIPLA